MSTDIPAQIHSELIELPREAQRRVLDFVRSLKNLGGGMSVDALNKHVGTLDPNEGKAMRDAIEAGCEQVNMDEW